MDEVMACTVMDSPPVVTRISASVALFGRKSYAELSGTNTLASCPKRVVECGNAPWIHHATCRVGAVEYIVDVVCGIFDVVEHACAVESQLIAARSAVSVVGHDTKFQVNRSKGWGQESRNGYVDGAIVASAAPA